MGLAQAGHGSRAALEDMRESDGVVYYSPRTDTDGETLREFTAIGWIAQVPPDRTGQAGQAGSGSYRPWRHQVDYDTDAVAASIRPLLTVLEFTRDDPNWGYQLRRGLIEISRHDYDLIRRQMRRG